MQEGERYMEKEDKRVRCYVCGEVIREDDLGGFNKNGTFHSFPMCLFEASLEEGE